MNNVMMEGLMKGVDHLNGKDEETQVQLQVQELHIIREGRKDHQRRRAFVI